MAARRGALILFEGVDRCGKTTQARKLVDALNTHTHACATFMRFPDRSTTIGGMIDAYLRQDTELDDRAVHLLFSANRWEKSREILSALESGKIVVVDRYAYSGVAFSSAKPGLDVEWCKHPDAGLPMPDLVLFMELSPEAAAARGGFGIERYEKEEFQRTVKSRFDELAQQTREVAPEVWQVIDASGTIDDIHAAILAKVTARAEEVAHAPIRKLWDGKS